MSVWLYRSSVPVYQRSLNAFLGVLDKAEEHARARKFDPANYLSVRLAPDMFPLAGQIRSFCDHAKNSSYRLAGEAPPVIEDNESTIAELRARINRTLDLIGSIESSAMEGGEDREILIPAGSNKMKMQAANYLLHFALPNFYFHLTTAYDILRAAGVEIGKRSFLGAVPGIAPA